MNNNHLDNQSNEQIHSSTESFIKMKHFAIAGWLCALAVLLFFTFMFLSQTLIKYSYRHQIREIALILSSKLDKRNNRVVIISEFSDITGNKSMVGKFLSEEITYFLADNSSSKIIDRRAIGRVLEEIKNSMPDTIDPVTAPSIGEFAAPNTLISGIVQESESNVLLNMKAIDIASNTVTATALCGLYTSEGSFAYNRCRSCIRIFG